MRYISYYFILLFGILLVALIRHRKLNFSQRCLNVMIFLTIAVEVLNIEIAKIENNNLWVSHYFTPIESSILLLAFAKESKWKNTWTISIILGIVLLSFLNGRYLQYYKSHINSYLQILSGIIFVALMLSYLHKYLMKDTWKPIWHHPLFLALLGYCLFSISGLLSFGMYNFYLTNESLDYPQFFNYLNIGFNFLLYTVVFFSFFVHESLNEVQNGK